MNKKKTTQIAVESVKMQTRGETLSRALL